MSQQNTKQEAARRAIKAGGGPRDLADRLANELGIVIKSETVRKWRDRGVPARYVPKVAELTGVPVGDLGPVYF